jgi:hypothetical protein
MQIGKPSAEGMPSMSESRIGYVKFNSHLRRIGDRAHQNDRKKITRGTKSMKSECASLCEGQVNERLGNIF